MEFDKGDKVVHPVYGAGRIEAIKEKQFLDHSNHYYVIHVPAKDITIMVPTNRAADAGLRPVSGAGVFDKMWAILRTAPQGLPDAYQDRQDGIREQLRTGDILQIAQAIRDLMGRSEMGKLTQADKGLLEQAETFIASELAIAHDLEIDEAKRLIRSALQSATVPSSSAAG